MDRFLLAEAARAEPDNSRSVLFQKVVQAAIADGVIESLDTWVKSHPEQAGMRAYALFLEIADLHGIDEARRIFKDTVKGTTKRDRARWKNEEILDLYDAMPKPNVRALARQLEQKGWGERMTVDHRIRDLLRNREAAMKEKTWDGPPLYDKQLNSYAYQKGLIKVRPRTCRISKSKTYSRISKKKF
jgi:hypothetical protein